MQNTPSIEQISTWLDQIVPQVSPGKVGNLFTGELAKALGVCFPGHAKPMCCITQAVGVGAAIALLPVKPMERTLIVRNIYMAWGEQVVSLHNQSPWLRPSMLDEEERRNIEWLRVGGAIEERGLSFGQVEFRTRQLEHDLVKTFGTDQRISKLLDRLRDMAAANLCAVELEQASVPRRKVARSRL